MTVCCFYCGLEDEFDLQAVNDRGWRMKPVPDYSKLIDGIPARMLVVDVCHACVEDPLRQAERHG